MRTAQRREIVKCKNKINYLFFALFIIILGFTSVDFSGRIDLVENQVNEFLIKNKVPSKKLFYYYALAARNLRSRNQYEHALKYYKKALEEKTDDSEHYLKALSEMVFLLEELQKLDELKIEVLKLEKFANQIGFIKNNPEYQFVIDYFKVISSNDLTRNSINKEYSYFQETIYYELILEHEFEARMRRGLYQEAYQMFLTHDHKISEHELRSAHDLLAFILKKNPSKWHCEDSVRDFPNSIAPSIKICHALLDRIYSKNNSALNTTNLPKDLEYMIPALRSVFN